MGIETLTRASKFSIFIEKEFDYFQENHEKTWIEKKTRLDRILTQKLKKWVMKQKKYL